jgi:transcriptional regulator with XRE-family HTH domain
MLGDNIKELMKLKKVTSKDLAEIVGVSSTHISYVINNKRYPSVELLGKIADVLEVSVDEFFKDESIRDDKLHNWKENHNKENKLAEQKEYVESIKLDTAEEAMKFILQQPSLMAFGGYDLNDMSEEEIMDLANDLLFAMKLSLEKMNRK